MDESFNTPADLPPPLPIAQPPVIGAPAPPKPPQKTPTGRTFLATFLSLCLLLFLADAVISLIDNSFILFLNFHLLAPIHGLVLLFSLLSALVLYALMALTPMVPKRIFLPVALFHPASGLLAIPFSIYLYGHTQQFAWFSSFGQVILALALLRWFSGRLQLRLPLIAGDQLRSPSFSWLNLSLFLALNLFVLLPALCVYSFSCAALAVSHFSSGFVSLRPAGLTVQVRQYVRPDGKTILLVPMAHIGEPEFYRKLSQSFPTDSIILMEGVTDNQNLLTNKISYKRVATSLGLAEQQKEFKPQTAERVRADVDISEFSPNTIGLLNLVMRLYSEGINPQTLLPLLQFPAPPDFEEQLLNDLLRKRNHHLLEEIQSQLAQSDKLIVPWGAAHMPEIAREIQKSGFHIAQTREYIAIRFRSAAKRSPAGTS